MNIILCILLKFDIKWLFKLKQNGIMSPAYNLHHQQVIYQKMN